jgi:hypothetical protein
MPDEPPAQRGSKAGRNEGRKLTATALNNTGVAFVLAALLQLALAYLQQQRSVDFPVMDRLSSWPSAFCCAGSPGGRCESWRIEMPDYYWNLIWLLVLVAVFAGSQWLAVRRIERDTPSRESGPR